MRRRKKFHEEARDLDYSEAPEWFARACESAGMDQDAAVALFNQHCKEANEEGYGRGTLRWALDYLHREKSAYKAESIQLVAKCTGKSEVQAANYLRGKSTTPAKDVVRIIYYVAAGILGTDTVPYWGDIDHAVWEEINLPEEQYEPLESPEGVAYMYAFNLLILGKVPNEDFDSKRLLALFLVSTLDEREVDGLLAMFGAFLEPHTLILKKSRRQRVNVEAGKGTAEDRHIFNEVNNHLNVIGYGIKAREVAEPPEEEPEGVPDF